MEQEGQKDLKEIRLKVFAGIKVMEKEMRGPVRVNKKEMEDEKLLKKSIDILESFRKGFPKRYEESLSELKQKREDYKRRWVEAKHESRKDLLDRLEKLAKQLEDDLLRGIVLPEETVRGLVKGHASATMQWQRDTKQIHNEINRDIDEELLELKDIESSWARWAAM